MSVAFKEWALVCEALGNGRQSLILRKGGIAEGRDGFAFKHPNFFLFPTWFHEQLARTTLPLESDVPAQLEGQIEIRYAATLEWSRLVTDAALLAPSSRSRRPQTSLVNCVSSKVSCPSSRVANPT